MLSCGGSRPSVQYLSDSHRTTPHGFGGGDDRRINLTCLHAFYRSLNALVEVADLSQIVKDVISASTPLQIRFSAVVLVSVLVVDFGKIEGIGDECFCYEFVDALCEVVSFSV